MVRRLLGVGGFGAVVDAFDRHYNCAVAIKIPHERYQSLPEGLYGFKNEFRTLSHVSHENLVALYELLSDGSTWFFTMELVEGVHLLDHVRSGAMGPTEMLERVTTVREVVETIDEAERGEVDSGGMVAAQTSVVPPDLSRVRRCFGQLVRGVRALHEADILHRDLKPTNVVVTPAGRTVVLDFGLAKSLHGSALDDAPRPRKGVIGTPTYMAPEQALGDPESEATDWYAVGVMLYQALCGRLPFSAGTGRDSGLVDPSASTYRLLKAKLLVDPLPPSALAQGVPPDLDQLCCDLLRRDPKARPGGDEIARRIEGADPDVARWSPRGAPRRDEGRGLVGRRKEMAALADALDERSAGEPVPVLVHGRSGVGKSALVQSFIAQIEQHGGAVVLTGRCYECEWVPYKAFDSLVDSLAQWLRRLPPGEARALTPDGSRALSMLFPVLRDIVDASDEPAPELERADPHETRRSAFYALKEMLRRIGAAHPLILCLDDLQWGDLDSAQLMVELLSPPGAPALLLLACCRSDEAEGGVFIREIKRLLPLTMRKIREVPILPLPFEHAVSLARDRIGGGPRERGAAPSWAESLAQESEGIPFFIEELARYARAVEADGAAALDVPRGEISIDSLIAARLRNLPAPSRRLLELTAVAGRPLPQSIAIKAADLGEAALSSLALLRSTHLLRTSQVQDRTYVELYHDRIRESIAAQLDPAARAERHRRIAEALEAFAHRDPEMLAVHFHGAGDLARAARYAAAAAERARDALAFDRAAELYARAVEWGTTGAAERRRLQIERAHALAHSGRSVEAASLYLSVAPNVGGADAADLQRRAAELLIVSGHVDQGVAVLVPVLTSLGLRYPATLAHALAEGLAATARLRARGHVYQERAEAALPARVVSRMDVCLAAGRALANIDPVRGMALQMRSLLLALEAGEPERIALGLFGLSSMSTLLGTREDLESGLRIHEEASAIARRLRSRYLIGTAAIHLSGRDLVLGHFRAALARVEQGMALLREQSAGIAWERNIGKAISMVALEALGDLKELAIRAGGWHREALSVGDLYARISSSILLSLTRLAADDAGGARGLLSDAMSCWSRRGFHVQHLYSLRISSYADLYEGMPNAALSRILAAWPSILLSQQLRVQFARFDMLVLRARATIGAACSRKSGQRLLLAAAERDAARIEREIRSDAQPVTALLRAGIARVRGDLDAALVHLGAAIRGFDAAGLRLSAAVARRRQGEILKGDQGRSLITMGEETMLEQGITRPSRWSAAMAPGFEP